MGKLAANSPRASYSVFVFAVAFVLSACSSAARPSNASASSSTESSPQETTTIANAVATTTTTTEAPSTTTSTTVAPDPTQLSDEQLFERAGPFVDHIPLSAVGDEFVGVFGDFDNGVLNDYLLARFTNRQTWTTEQVTGWPESYDLTVDQQPTDEGLATLISTEFRRAALLTSTDGSEWQREALPDVFGEPRALASSGEQLAVLIVDDSADPPAISISSGPVGGPFVNTPFLFDLPGSFDIPFVADDGGIFVTAITDRGRSIVSLPWNDLSTGTIVDPEGEGLDVLDMVVAPDGTLYVVTDDTLWATSDRGESWDQSAIPTELSPVEGARVVAESNGLAVQLTSQEVERTEETVIVLQPHEVWHRPIEDDWTLTRNWTTFDPQEPFSYPAGERSVDAFPALHSIDDEHISIRWDVRTISIDDSGTLGSGGSAGSFFEQIPIG